MAPDGQPTPDELSELRAIKDEVLRPRGLVAQPSPRTNHEAIPCDLTSPNVKEAERASVPHKFLFP
ncbi:hypothetical protein PF005_g8525 [Phytophthora fragariae]|uniref:Uncharacterized protein n=1 Tax=Phytophthora fragariae TaxID=53985 RepID=A0A6A3YHB9_9STRA|nr:hypothetical protein PF003_g29830 [Phytophthora fragariae]KAE8941302.1 hypothetical protein PF009_g8909 [Phytophthora fragariae]KAE9119244.1 hypothetical protein PF007_g8623 [Phytophthora fragariae]KAE9119436.1 hypothetical protein PF010_g7877 [Phytophthora fragariae]KAE9148016.1 hypothetical protein PF006_g7368 [Phytophthora fragariae]